MSHNIWKYLINRGKQLVVLIFWINIVIEKSETFSEWNVWHNYVQPLQFVP